MKLSFGRFGAILVLIVFIDKLKEGQSETLNSFLQHKPQLKLFFMAVEKSQYLKSALAWKEGTLFAPTDEAIGHYEENQRVFDHMTLLYHFANVPHRYSEIQAEKSISTEIPGNSLLWITNLQNKMYINDALVVSNSDYVVEVEGSSKQIVHIIDAVLEPTIPHALSSTYLHNPDAFKFIQHTKSYTISNGYETKNFSRQISMKRKSKLYSDVGRHTFFVPVDKDITQLNLDEAIINGHIIQNEALFLRSVELNKEFETFRAIGGINQSLHVVLSFEKGKINGQEKWLIQSDTRHGDTTHRKGVVQAEIVRGNIPVKNGVVHLISKPLVIIDTNVFDTLEWYGGKFIFNMKSFLDIIRHMERREQLNEFRNILKDPSGVTLFVPSNEALQDPEFQSQKQNMTAMNQILKTHITKKIISADDMTEHSRMKIIPFQVPTLIPGKQLLFSSIHPHHGETIIHVEGGGANATVLHADFGATNGFIHIIDKVLGIPKQSIMEKLSTHPMLKSTYQLWKKARLDEKYNDSDEPYTIFAPDERAWESIRLMNQFAYDNLFNSDGSIELLRTVLERHLITKRDLTIMDLKLIALSQMNNTMAKGFNLTTITFPIKTVGGLVLVNESQLLLPSPSGMASKPKPRLQLSSTNAPQYVGFENTEDEPHYYVYWNKIRARVIRPDVKCTNGILHIVDYVFMDNVEIAVASANSLIKHSLAPILTCLVLLSAILVELNFV